MARAATGRLVETVRELIGEKVPMMIRNASKFTLVKSSRVDYAVRAHRRAIPSTTSEGFCKTSNNVVHLVRDRVIFYSPADGLLTLSKGGCQRAEHKVNSSIPVHRELKESACFGKVTEAAPLTTGKGGRL